MIMAFIIDKNNNFNLRAPVQSLDSVILWITESIACNIKYLIDGLFDNNYYSIRLR